MEFLSDLRMNNERSWSGQVSVRSENFCCAKWGMMEENQVWLLSGSGFKGGAAV